MQQAKTASLPVDTRNKIAGKPPLLDCATQTCIIRSGKDAYLIRERSDTGEVIGVVGRWICGSNRADTLRPDKEKGEFIHRHEAGYYYRLGKVEAADAEGIVKERNASR